MRRPTGTRSTARVLPALRRTPDGAEALKRAEKLWHDPLSLTSCFVAPFPVRRETGLSGGLPLPRRNVRPTLTELFPLYLHDVLNATILPFEAAARGTLCPQTIGFDYNLIRGISRSASRRTREQARASGRNSQENVPVRLPATGAAMDVAAQRTRLWSVHVGFTGWVALAACLPVLEHGRASRPWHP